MNFHFSTMVGMTANGSGLKEVGGINTQILI